MENRAYALSAGLFLLLLGIGLVLAVMRLTGETTRRVEYVIESTVPVSGLQQNAPVRLRGVEVGKVTGIEFAADDPRVVLVRIAVDLTAPIKKGVYAQLGYLGITGLSYVQLDFDADRRAKAASGDAGSGDKPVRITMRPSIFDEVSDAAPDFVQDSAEAAKRVNRLLSDENLNAVSGAIANVNLASADLARLTEDLRPAAHALRKSTARIDKSLQLLDPLLSNLNSLVYDVRSRVGAIDRIGESAEDVGRAGRSIEIAAPALVRALDDFSRTLRRADHVLADIEQRPQSLLFGRNAPPPGPGEAGFVAPMEPAAPTAAPGR